MTNGRLPAWIPVKGTHWHQVLGEMSRWREAMEGEQEHGDEGIVEERWAAGMGQGEEEGEAPTDVQKDGLTRARRVGRSPGDALVPFENECEWSRTQRMGMKMRQCCRPSLFGG